LAAFFLWQRDNASEWERMVEESKQNPDYLADIVSGIVI